MVAEKSFEAPVDEFVDYTRTSAPLTRAINVNGQDVEARVRLFWGRPGTDTDPDTADGGSSSSSIFVNR